MYLKLSVSAEVVDKALHRYLSDPGSDAQPIVEGARRFGAVPLWVDFMGCCALRPSGDVIFFSHDEPTRAEPVRTGLPDAAILHVARVRGAIRFPEIDGLMPVRPDDAIICRSCKGLGTIASVKKHPNLVCECGGLGWLPPELVTPAG